MYPSIESAEVLCRYRLGPYGASLFGDIESSGSVHYLYVLALIEVAQEEVSLYVTSEVNELAQELGGGSHFLCVFNNEGHHNLGNSDDWADLERFATKALSLAGEMLDVADPPEQLPLPVVGIPDRPDIG